MILSHLCTHLFYIQYTLPSTSVHATDSLTLIKSNLRQTPFITPPLQYHGLIDPHMHPVQFSTVQYIQLAQQTPYHLIPSTIHMIFHVCTISLMFCRRYVYYVYCIVLYYNPYSNYKSISIIPKTY